MSAVYLDDILLVMGRARQQAHTICCVYLRDWKRLAYVQAWKSVHSWNHRASLSHKLDTNGIHSTPYKLSAIQNAPRPSPVYELTSFLGTLNYYHKFLRNLGLVLAPLHALLQKGTSGLRE